MDLLQVLNYWIYFVFYCSLWSNNRVCIMLLRYRSTWVAHMRNEGNFNQNKMSWSEYMDTWAQFWIWININHPCLSEYNFALNEPNRIRIFQLTCLYDAFLFWSALYSKYLCPCKQSSWQYRWQNLGYFGCLYELLFYLTGKLKVMHEKNIKRTLISFS